MANSGRHGYCVTCGDEIFAWENAVGTLIWSHLPNGKNHDHTPEPISGEASPVEFMEIRCTLCGAQRLTTGACSFIGCKDPLHDFRIEQMEVAAGEASTGEQPPELDFTEPDLASMERQCEAGSLTWKLIRQLRERIAEKKTLEAHRKYLLDKVKGAARPVSGTEPSASKVERSLNMENLQRDAARYWRLRVLGCAPCGSTELATQCVMRFTNLDAFVDADIRINPSRGETELYSQPTQAAVSGTEESAGPRTCISTLGDIRCEKSFDHEHDHMGRDSTGKVHEWVSWPAKTAQFSCTVCGMNMAEPCQHWCETLLRKLTAVAPSLTLRCPKCGDGDLALQIISLGNLACGKCKFHFTIKQPVDFAQFFSAQKEAGQ